MRSQWIAILVLFLAACSGGKPRDEAAPASSSPVQEVSVKQPDTPPAVPAPNAAGTQLATFAGGCYWCIEAVFEQIPGVIDAKSGFMGGNVANPTYEAVCDHLTGHAEVVQITFDPAKVTYETLLETFWHAHDPTTLNAQGPDSGDQYRSAIYFHSPEQKAAAETSKRAVQKDFPSPIVTEITAASDFYAAPEGHQDYYVNNREQGYCRAIIRPKLKKLGLKE